VIVIILQLGIIYIPGLNFYVFQMAAMDADQWGIAVLFTVLQFIGMELEKALRRYLRAKGRDTDDREITAIDKILASHEKQPAERGSFRPDSKHDIARIAANYVASSITGCSLRNKRRPLLKTRRKRIHTAEALNSLSMMAFSFEVQPGFKLSVTSQYEPHLEDINNAPRTRQIEGSRG